MSRPAAGTRLTDTQRAVMDQIIRYGKAHGFLDYQIRIAVKTAYIESKLGKELEPNPKSSASGLFGYTDRDWESDYGKKNDNSNQIRAFYDDLAAYSWRYYIQPYGPIPKKDVSLPEYIYIKHHDGRNATPSAESVGKEIWDHELFEIPEDAVKGPRSDAEPQITAPTAARNSASYQSEQSHVPSPRQDFSYSQGNGLSTPPGHADPSWYTPFMDIPNRLAPTDPGIWSQNMSPISPDWMNDNAFLRSLPAWVDMPASYPGEVQQPGSGTLPYLTPDPAALLRRNQFYEPMPLNDPFVTGAMGQEEQLDPRIKSLLASWPGFYP